MNAKEAHDKALDLSNKKINEQYDEVKHKIDQEVSKGNLCLDLYNKQLLTVVIEKLSKEGYGVHVLTGGRNETDTKITW